MLGPAMGMMAKCTSLAGTKAAGDEVDLSVLESRGRTGSTGSLWVSVVVKLGPFKKGAPCFVGDVTCMAHPKVLAKVLLFPRHQEHFCRSCLVSQF